VFIDVPFDVEKTFGSKARVSVSGSINGFGFQNSLMPNGDGTHSMPVNKTLQAGAKAKAGETVSVTIEMDIKERVVALPAELEAALNSDEAASKMYKTLSPSHQKEFSDWVGGAKQPATRIARAAKSLPPIRERAYTR
jgi:uncharacterized protein DUF1905/bacteriocin resistance YdeI/OmpD-like protein